MLVAFTGIIYAADIHHPSDGLYIQAYPTPGNMHTTLSLDGGMPIMLEGGELRLSADVWLRPENVLGTVFRIITDTGANVDLMYSVENDVRYPMLVTGEDVQLQTVTPPLEEWVPVSVTISPKLGKVSLVYNGIETNVEYPELKNAGSVRIDWGLCLIEGKTLNDVASVTVKDIEVMLGGKKIRHWKLHGHRGDVCYDEIAGMPAKAVNPRWIIDESATWNKIFTTTSLVLPSVAFDPVIATFYMVGKGRNELYVFHPSENVVDTISTTGGNHVAVVPNQLIYIEESHTLLSYNLSENLFSSFDPTEHTWSSLSKADPDHDFWFSSVCYNKPDSAIVSFGGYGHYRYNNNLFTSHPFSKKPQTEAVLDEIDPRRSSSTAIVDGYLYIYGGWGCHSGRQELSAHAYYDMYRVNLSDNRVEALWKHDSSPFGSDFIGVENMVYIAEEKAFYVFSTLDGGVLLKISPDNDKMEKVSLPVGFDMDNHSFYGNLFYSPEQGKLYAALVSSDVDDRAELSIYELPFPPVPVSDLSQPEGLEFLPKESFWTSRHVVWIAVVAAAVIAGFAVWTAIRRRRGVANKGHNAATEPEDIDEPEPESVQENDGCPLPDTQHETDEADTLTSGNDNLHGAPHVEDVQDVAREGNAILESSDLPKSDADSAESVAAGGENVTENVTPFFFGRMLEDEQTPPGCIYYPMDKGCIRFLGGFRVFDQDGNDMTSQFTPILKNLLLVLVFHSDDNSIGISNARLQNLLWRGKEEEAAKNSRNVYLSRLRALLTQIGDMSVTINKGLRRIEVGENVMIDYLEAKALLKDGSGTNIGRLLELLGNGVMLPNVEVDYIDPFKSSFSDEVIECMSKFIRDESFSLDLRLKMANVLFQHDPVNEDALFMKCQILHYQGRTGLAQSVYNSFCREYRSLLGGNYPRTFTEIIKQSN